MINYEEISIGTGKYVTSIYEQNKTAFLVYHNLLHTKKVLSRAKEISSNYPLTTEELFIVTAAAWFHDIGHLFGAAAGHERRGIIVMRGYLEKEGVEPATLDSIEQCILSTKLPNDPKSLLAEILCDADCYHLGTDEFHIVNEQVKTEFELRNHELPLNWDEATLHLLEQHKYFTPYCFGLLETGKQKNIHFLRKKLNRI